MDPYLASRMLTAAFAMHGLWCSHRECFAHTSTKSDEQVLDESIAHHARRTRSLTDPTMDDLCVLLPEDVPAPPRPDPGE